MSKKFFSLGLSILLFLTALYPAAVMAAEETTSEQESTVSIQYVYINQASTSLTISPDGTASIYGYVQRTPSGSSIQITSTLQQYSNGSWLNIKSWSEYSTSWSALISETYPVNRGTYRVRTYYYVSGSNGYESDNVYSKNVIY
jgi:hypothetical protein